MISRRGARSGIALVGVGLRLKRILSAMLTAADISISGPVRCLLVEGLQGVYLVTLRAWMNDDTADMAKTMAALIARLDQAERVMRFPPRRRAGAKPPSRREPCAAPPLSKALPVAGFF